MTSGPQFYAIHRPIGFGRRRTWLMTAPIRGPRGISEDRIVEMTGRTTADWNELLDAFDVHRHGHTAAARYPREAQGLSGWWAQAVTVRYEYARDLRDTLGMPEELATALDAAAVRNEFDRLSPTEQREAFEAV